jgi:hypothetical protein
MAERDENGAWLPLPKSDHQIFGLNVPAGLPIIGKLRAKYSPKGYSAWCVGVTVEPLKPNEYHNKFYVRN